MLSVTTNTAALTAQRNLSQASDDASSSIAKMSSGSRIVKPSDDAASLAISNKLKADIASLEQAGRNASQGASLLQVANGAYDNISDMLTRMKVLATQVINGTLSTTERLYAQEEFDNLRTQISSTAAQTRFAGVALLTGGGGSYLQAGEVVETNPGDGSTANISDLTNGEAGLRTSGASRNDFFDSTSVAGAVNSGFVHGNITDISVSRNGSALQVSMRIGTQIFTGGIDASNATAGDSLVLTSSSNPANSVEFVLANNITNITTENTRRLLQEGLSTLLSGASYTTVNPDAATVDNGFTGIGSTVGPTINGVQVPIVAGSGTDPGTYAFEYVSTGNETVDGAVGYVATGDDRRGTGFFRLTNGAEEWTVDVEDIQITGTEGSAGAYGIVTFSNGLQVYLDMGATAANAFDRGDTSSQFYRFDVGEGSGVSLNFQIAEESSDQVTVRFTAASAAALGLEELSLKDEASATIASARIDDAINTVNTATANIGAIMSRFEFIQSTISTTVENVSAAKGTFYDVDMAAEMTEFTRAQTLMSASVAMLSQANQMPQELLNLLKG